MEYLTRKKRTTRLIGSYVEGIEFEQLRNLIHSLIEWIKIKHHKVDGKMGEFIVELKYKGYDETSTFLTNWQASKWLWLTTYRAAAYTNEQLQEDREDFLGILEFYGVQITKQSLKQFKNATGYSDEEINMMNPFSDEFTGLEVRKGLHETIVLNEEDIIYFD